MTGRDADPPGLDLAALQQYLHAERPGLVRGPLTADLLTGGRSNLTYRVTDARSSWVLRRPPLGNTLATAHDMQREHRVMAALEDSPVPVPRMILLCRDEKVLGSEFLLMEFVPGRCYRDETDTRTLDRDGAAALSYELVDVLAALHAVSPVSVGLADLGRPAGYLDRQLRRWTRQLESFRIRDIAGVDDLVDALHAGVPRNSRVAVVHGDYRLDNVLVDDSLHIRAVVDWEMATLGDPLADLGLLGCYWMGVDHDGSSDITKGIRRNLGFPPFADLSEYYAEVTGHDVSALPWYVALGYFKMAVIREGIHIRHKQGKTVGDEFAGIGDLVEPLVEAARVVLQEQKRELRT